MTDTVFDFFEVTPYTFLSVNRGKVRGNIILETFPANGVFKLRNGMVSVNNQESQQSDATLHIKPNEVFAEVDMVGQGIRKDGIDYKIVGQTAGTNFDTNELEHYRLTLQRAKFVEEAS